MKNKNRNNEEGERRIKRENSGNRREERILESADRTMILNYVYRVESCKAWRDLVAAK